MTTDQPGTHPLRRRAEDRVIAGVASGLGDFLNVDPLLIRIAFVGLMVFGGLGLILYVGGWLLLPDETRGDSIAEQVLHRLGLGPIRLVTGILLILGVLILLQAMNNYYIEPWVALAVFVLVAGVVVLQSGGRNAAVAAPPATATAAMPAATTAPAVRRRRRPPSPLGWYVLGATFAAIGLFALVANVAELRVNPGQFFGVGLGVIGIGLVVGAWWGRARLLILLGIAVLPLGVGASFVTAPIEGGIGDQFFSPASSAELRDAYRLVGGRMTLDLTRIDASGGPVVITASVAVGQLRVTLPADASIQATAAVGAGDLVLLGTTQYGSDLSDRYVRDGSGPRFILDLEAGIGEVIVDGGPVGGR